MSVTECAGLAVAGAMAGAMNAVAGGGTLITFPALLFFGTPPVVANATSTVALVIGTAGSIYGYRTHLPMVRRWAATFLPVSVAGGLLGGILLTRTSNEVFGRMVPFLILFATLVFLAQGTCRKSALLEAVAASAPGHSVVWCAVVFQLLVATYGGYFGAGIGILMLASLGLLGLTNIHEMNALKTLLGSLINLVAASWFICAGLIQWPKAFVMIIGAVCGYFLGAHFSQRIPQSWVRHIITMIGFTIAAVTFYNQFCR
jgi:uncharacterized membrane protein YfcA